MSVTLGYWGIRGRAQPIRFLLEYLQVPYEDRKYTQPEEWYGKDKQKFGNNPLINLPYLKDGEKTVFESTAIPIYLAYKTNRQDLLGKDEFEQVSLAQTNGVVSDIVQAFNKTIQFIPKAEYEANGKQIFAEKIVPLLKKLDQFIGGKKFATGDNITLVDFMLYELEDSVRCFSEETFNSLTNLTAHFANFSEIPQIKAYRSSGRFQERPFMPPGYANWG